MKITFYGHSSLGIELNGKHILVDPFISANPNATSISIDTLKADYILLTHAHYDHIMDVDAIVERTGATIISNHEIVTYYGQKNYKGHAMNQGGSFTFDFGTIKAVNAVHSSSFPDGTYGGNPIGFVLTANGKSIYISGDTALTLDMQLLPLFFQLDLAIFPIGGNFTMDVSEAIVASDFVKCNKILGVHYDTAELIAIDHEASINEFKKSGKELILLSIGESLQV
jgi:L-ascorbate metabolism protein UlaG (beta-lactamase superfamily)